MFAEQWYQAHMRQSRPRSCRTWNASRSARAESGASGLVRGLVPLSVALALALSISFFLSLARPLALSLSPSRSLSFSLPLALLLSSPLSRSCSLSLAFALSFTLGRCGCSAWHPSSPKRNLHSRNPKPCSPEFEARNLALLNRKP